MIKKICTICKLGYQVKPYRSGSSDFCSTKCRGVSMRGHVPWNKGVKYDDKLKSKLNISGLIKGWGWSKGTKGVLKVNKTSFKKGHSINKGEKSYMWKGGITPTNKLIRRSVEYRLWREAVFKRDDYTCQECKERGGELHPHHIKPFAHFPELRLAIDNGVTLCADCHRKTDTWGNPHKKVKIIASN